ncbi:MAG TPA: glycosyltransferase family 4 protein [Gammaproteobacteria bacterium]|nr:glycosyltransferase family 4 protein [Gammaproteobacteria bacterium]
MSVLLYRPSLDLRSGTGQLMLAQLKGLEAAGVDARLACERGRWRFFLRTGVVPAGVVAADARRAAATRFIVDHGLAVPQADVVFVHNLATEAVRHLERDDWVEAARGEAAFFAALNPAAPIVANSRLVAGALVAHHGIPRERIVVHYPGYARTVFAPGRAAALRSSARGALGIDASAPLVGFVTSGDFRKRGLDLFLESAARIAAARPATRFLVVGSKTLPDWARAHGLVRSGRLLHRPKGREPERWMAALDLFLYAARFEEFGLVVLEAQALGVPVLTSGRVGAAECLAPEYGRWLIDAPDASAFAANADTLLADVETRRRLSAAGAAHAAAFDRDAYVTATLETLRAAERFPGARASYSSPNR